jgi:hypothetical protein
MKDTEKQRHTALEPQLPKSAPKRAHKGAKKQANAAKMRQI